MSVITAVRESHAVTFRFLCTNAPRGPEWKRYDLHISKEPVSHPASVNSIGKFVKSS
jgi:hypothetical protein